MLTPDRVGMWDASVDYLRLTHRKGHDDYGVANRYARAIEKWGRLDAGREEHAETWAWRGYRGERVGAAAWGEHDAGFVLQVSGGAARQAPAEELPYTNVPRLDLQVTFWLTQEDAGVAARVAQLAAAFRPATRGRRGKVRYIQGYGDGDTAYIGSRGKKSKFLRCYDKWRESELTEGYRYAWRFEAELTDQHAVLACGSLMDLPRTHYAIYALVAGYYAERGCALPAMDGVATILPEALPKDAGSDERRLRWLKHQVAPTVERLRTNGVAVDDIVTALGLTREDVLRAYLHHSK